MVEIADAAGFPSEESEGVVFYLLDRFDNKEKKRYVLLAHMRFRNVVHKGEGSDKEKVAAAMRDSPTMTDDGKDDIDVGLFLKCALLGGGAEGILGAILKYE